jgi:hypothetical protein
MPGSNDDPRSLDRFPPELRQLSATAIDALDRHLHSGGRCVICLAARPGERAQMAAQTLAAI